MVTSSEASIKASCHSVIAGNSLISNIMSVSLIKRDESNTIKKLIADGFFLFFIDIVLTATHWIVELNSAEFSLASEQD